MLTRILVSGVVYQPEIQMAESIMKSKLFFFFLVLLTTVNSDNVNAQGSEHVGNKLIDFKVKTLQGENITIQDVIKDKAVVINFTTTWCTDCKKLAKFFNKIIPRYRKKGLEFYFIYVGQRREIVSLASKNINKINSPIIFLDEKRKAAVKLGVQIVPHLIIVDKKGIVKYEGVQFKEKQITAEIEKVIK